MKEVFMMGSGSEGYSHFKRKIMANEMTDQEIEFFRKMQKEKSMNDEREMTNFEAKMEAACQSGISIRPMSKGGWTVRMPAVSRREDQSAAFSTLDEVADFIREEYTDPDAAKSRKSSKK